MKITVTETGNNPKLESIASMSERGIGTYIGKINTRSDETIFFVGEMVADLGTPVIAFDLENGGRRCWVVPHTLTAKSNHYCQSKMLSNVRPCEISEIKVIA